MRRTSAEKKHEENAIHRAIVTENEHKPLRTAQNVTHCSATYRGWAKTIKLLVDREFKFFLYQRITTE